ncbi:hypothetical protein AV530_002294 [Patagioenas fasciata monilis]|uniref:Uncharacterized protein n=1 Tax=Patagioenas fasciata monilis TaxID=372326 RepID=A0A1V4K5T1_PATFA|nr:hypothetical protein AV530_002294 [Patagioenas fasciata monilis]
MNQVQGSTRGQQMGEKGDRAGEMEQHESKVSQDRQFTARGSKKGHGCRFTSKSEHFLTIKRETASLRHKVTFSPCH